MVVHTGAPLQQLRLFDIHSRMTEIYSFGWKSESSDSQSQSALIKQAWSADGLYLSSGCVDPAIHIFDIRYKVRGPSQTLKVHKKRVFKAIWHQSVSQLTSISSDVTVDLHKVCKNQ